MRGVVESRRGICKSFWGEGDIISVLTWLDNWINW